MARSDTPNLSARPVRAEVPPANYWQRWSVANAAPAAAVQAHITEATAGSVTTAAAAQAPGLQAANAARIAQLTHCRPRSTPTPPGFCCPRTCAWTAWRATAR